MSPLSLLEPEMSPQHLPQTIVCYNHALARRTAQCVCCDSLSLMWPLTSTRLKLTDTIVDKPLHGMRLSLHRLADLLTIQTFAGVDKPSHGIPTSYDLVNCFLKWLEKVTHLRLKALSLR